MTVSTYHPASISDSETSAVPLNKALSNHDDIRIMPSSLDLNKPHSEKALIEQALAQEQGDHSNLIASSRDDLPTIHINGVMLDKRTIAKEVQYHPAASKEDAVFLASQALVVRELLKQSVFADPDLGENAWQHDEEQAISALIDKHVQATTPDKATCERYYQQNQSSFVTPPLMKVRHILLACLPEDGEQRLKVKKSAYHLIKEIQQSDNPDAEFISLVQQYSACPSKTQGGDLGVISKGQTVPELESVLFNLDTGLAPSPIESRYGFHIVDVTDKQSGIQMSFEQAYPAIVNQLSQQAFHHALCDYLYTLVDLADIVGIEMTLTQENIFRS